MRLKRGTVTTYDVLVGDARIAIASIKTLVPRFSVVPANADLVGLEADLVAEANRPYPAA